jgi:hypothetical protein
MEINSLNGAGAYANASGTATPVDNTRQNQTSDASQNAMNTGNTAAGSQAFEVTITREAQDRLAAQTNTQVMEEPTETQGAAMTPGPQNQNTASTRETSQIVNIVA